MSEKWNTTDAPWYESDSFGLKSLDQAGGLFYETTPGDHLQFSQEVLLGFVTKYFN
jgi:hypothetical protein